MNVKPVCILAAAVLFCVSAVGVSADNNAMIVHGDKMYIVSGTTLARVDLSTFEVEMKKDLTLICKEKAEEEAMQKRKAYLSNYDKDKDGKVTEDEAGKRWRWLKRNDDNGDGVLVAEELSIYAPRSPAAYGEASLLVNGDSLFMLRSGSLFVFSAAGLDFKKMVEVAPKKNDEEYIRSIQFKRNKRGEGYFRKTRGQSSKKVKPEKQEQKNEEQQAIF